MADGYESCRKAAGSADILESAHVGAAPWLPGLRRTMSVCSGAAPNIIRSDDGPEFIATALRDWIAAVGNQTVYVEPGSP